MATFMNKEEELQSKLETLEYRIERLERALKNISKQQCNCNLPHVSISACCNDLSNRYWDKNGSKCLKCGKIFTS